MDPHTHTHQTAVLSLCIMLLNKKYVLMLCCNWCLLLNGLLYASSFYIVFTDASMPVSSADINISTKNVFLDSHLLKINVTIFFLLRLSCSLNKLE
jgi:hypothetical protein